MAYPKPSLSSLWQRTLVGCLLVAIAVWVVSCARGTTKEDLLNGVLLTGVHHLGPDFKITQFYLDGYDGSNIGRGSGDGGDICCVRLPAKWRKNLSVEVRWEVEDWGRENKAEIKSGIYKSIALEGTYKAIVPVERYETASHLFVHFFPGGRARVVSSEVGWGNPKHPIPEDIRQALQKATAGVRIDDLFSEAELEAMDKKRKAQKKSWFGGGEWR